jgi:hypothetical protein
MRNRGSTVSRRLSGQWLSILQESNRDRQFLQKLAANEDEDEKVRMAARQTLQLPLVQAASD